MLTAEAGKSHTRTAQCKCKAMVGEAVVAECEIKFMLVDNDKL
jgi:3-hydroxymyristoyl/3-hydroxydecanoyl-(acyl carrier protein) dehydratase